MEQGQVLSQLSGEQKVFPDEFPRFSPDLLDQAPVMQKESDAVRRAFGSVDEETGVVVENLLADPSHVPADDRLSLPKSFGHRQAETFTGRFLDNYVRHSLEGIYGAVGIRRQQQDMHSVEPGKSNDSNCPATNASAST